MKHPQQEPGKAHSLPGTLWAHGFRLTGWRRFIRGYVRERNLLLSEDEIYGIAVKLRQRPGSLLIFGAGNDSLLWAAINRGHPTAILESDAAWQQKIQAQNKSLRIFSVSYTTSLSDILPPDEPMPEPARLDLPAEITNRRWDWILIDAPQGWGDGPGRWQSLNESLRLVAEDGRIFLHDCERQGERWLISHYLRDWHREELTFRLSCFRK
jgi:hypothetical protein